MRSGALVAGTKLLWPQTEYIKACVARAEWLDDKAARAAIRAHLALIAQHFMRPDGANWHNQLARDGTPMAPVDAGARAVSPVLGGGGGGADVGEAANRASSGGAKRKRGASLHGCTPRSSMRREQSYIPAFAFS